MNSFEFTAIRKLQAERGDTDSQVAEFLQLVEVGSSLAPVEWAALAHELEKRAYDIRCIDWEIYREAAAASAAQEPTMELPF